MDATREAGGPTWTVKAKKGRRTFSKGVWACRERVEEVKRQLDAERSTDAYAKRKIRDQVRREEKQAVYVDDFRSAVLAFLDFHPRFEKEAEKIATLVTRHSTPVGSGTVARLTDPHRKTGGVCSDCVAPTSTTCDHMKIPRVKGKRREVRRMRRAIKSCWRVIVRVMQWGKMTVSCKKPSGKCICMAVMSNDDGTEQ